MRSFFLGRYAAAGTSRDSLLYEGLIRISYPGSLVIVYALVNGLVFLVFGLDKRRAQNSMSRMREKILLGLAFLGPFGALSAMDLFRHKTRKIKFYFVPVFACIHLTLIVYGFIFLL